MFGFFRGLMAWWTHTTFAARAGLAHPARARTCGTWRPSFEQLETRDTPSIVNITAADQLLIELINRARANPAAEAARFGISLNQGLVPGTLSTAAEAPLAPQQALVNAAVIYSNTMYSSNFFSHVDPQGRHSWDRAAAQGYPSSYVGENIAWGTYNTTYNTQTQAVNELVTNFFLSPDHRANMLNPAYNEVGTGVTFGHAPYQSATQSGLGVVIATEDFGYRATQPYLTGVAYNDQVVTNHFYDIGEGLAGVTITATSSTGKVYSTVTAAAGGYALQVTPGIYTVRASGGGLSQPITYSNVRVGTLNVKEDFIPTQSTSTSAPSMNTIPNQTISAGQTLFVALAPGGVAPAGVSFQVAIQADNSLYDLEQQLLLYQYNSTYNYNALGQKEKWLRSARDGTIYILLSTGKLVHWNGSLATSPVVSTLDVSVYQNPLLLNLAQPSTTVPAVKATMSGGLLTLTPSSSWTGSFHVVVTATGGSATASQSFVVTVH